MQMLKDAILERGKALNQDVLLVDSFLNHQVDVALMEKIGEEFAKYFADRGITRVVTIESSGIAPASFTALALGLPLVIMKKQTSRILKGDLLQTTVRSFTKGTQYELTVKREFLPAGEKILYMLGTRAPICSNASCQRRSGFRRYSFGTAGGRRGRRNWHCY